jgi:hypothetical protein
VIFSTSPVVGSLGGGLLMKRVLAGAIAAAVLTAAAPVNAEGPMTPVRPLTAPGGARQWVEPPPAATASIPAPPAPAAAPEAAASTPAIPIPAVAATEPEPQASSPNDARPSRSHRRSASTGGARGTTANRLNRQERTRTGGTVYYAPYYRGYGYGPSPNGGAGD